MSPSGLYGRTAVPFIVKVFVHAAGTSRSQSVYVSAGFKKTSRITPSEAPKVLALASYLPEYPPLGGPWYSSKVYVAVGSTAPFAVLLTVTSASTFVRLIVWTQVAELPHVSVAVYSRVSVWFTFVVELVGIVAGELASTCSTVGTGPQLSLTVGATRQLPSLQASQATVWFAGHVIVGAFVSFSEMV